MAVKKIRGRIKDSVNFKALTSTKMRVILDHGTVEDVDYICLMSMIWILVSQFCTCV
jgi:hypothetical protein